MNENQVASTISDSKKMRICDSCSDFEIEEKVFQKIKSMFKHIRKHDNKARYVDMTNLVIYDKWLQPMRNKK